jgi:hypothetical protein
MYEDASLLAVSIRLLFPCLCSWMCHLPCMPPVLLLT